MASKLRAFISNIGYTTASFVLAVSTLTAAVPFILSERVGALTTVNSQAELVAAIAGSDDLIILGSSFAISSQVNINRTLTLDGNGHELSGEYTATGGGNDSVLAVVGGNPTITDVVIEGDNGTELQGIQVWNSSAVLSDITSRNHNKAGIHVNNSTVSAHNVTTSNNSRGKSTFGIPHFGGMVVSGGSLTISGQSNHATELGHIRRNSGIVVDINSQYSNWLNFIYTLKAAPVAPSFLAPTPSNSAVITDDNTVTVAWNMPSYASTFEYRINGGSPVATSAQSFTQDFANGTYTVEVRSVAASGLTGSWSTVRTFTMSFYEYAAADSKFVGSPKYVQANGAHASHNISAEVHVPTLTDQVRFYLNGNGPVDGTYINAVNAANARWRLIASVIPGEHLVTAEYRVNGIWYSVTGNGTVYSIDGPTAQYVTPNDTSNVFRPSDNPIRLKVEDQFEQFARMVVTIKQGATTIGTYEVLRANCDVRQAGNYLFCDVDASSTWLSNLADGVYTASTTTYTKANNRVDNLLSREFTIDGQKPSIVSLTSPAVVSSVLGASAVATDNVAVESVNFYVTEPRYDGACTGNGPKFAELRVSSPTSGSYVADLDVATLNGVYCLSAVARDLASGNSEIVSNTVTIDNTDPTVEISNVTITGKMLSFDVSGTDNLSGARTVGVNIYNEANTGDAIIAIGRLAHNIPAETLSVGPYNVAGIDLSGLPSGTYTIRAAIRDWAGNLTYETEQFTIDNTAPTINYIGFDSDENVITPILTVDDLDVASYLWEYVSGPVDGAVISDATVLNPDFTVTEDGSYVYRLTVTDTAGNSSTRDFSFTYTAPAEEIEDEDSNSDDDDAPDAPTQTPFTDVGVLGDQDTNPDLTPEADEQEVEGDATENVAEATDTDNNTSLFGLAWYWWLLIVAALATGLWWLIAALRRRNSEA